MDDGQRGDGDDGAGGGDGTQAGVEADDAVVTGIGNKEFIISSICANAIRSNELAGTRTNGTETLPVIAERRAAGARVNTNDSVVSHICDIKFIRGGMEENANGIIELIGSWTGRTEGLPVIAEGRSAAA